jgi:hypothetical protein
MIVTLFHSVSKAYIEDMRDVLDDISWTDFAQILQDKQNINEKEQGTLYNLARFKNIGDKTALLGRKKIFKNGEWTGEYKYFDNTVRRCKENLVAISGILLDFDKDVTIENVISQYQGIEYVLYTTFNHTIDSHRFRMVIPFTIPLLFEDIERKKQSIKDTFKGVDDASFSAGQSFYFHAGHNDPIAFHNKGYMIDPYTDFIDGVVEDKKVVKDFKSAFELTPEYQQKIIDSLLTCSGLRYTHALTLVAICKTYGLGFNDFNNICSKISDNDSTLVKMPSCRKDLWNSDYEKITVDKRDKFIKERGGRPISKKIDKTIDYKKDLEDMKLIEKLIRMKKNGRTN